MAKDMSATNVPIIVDFWRSVGLSDDKIAGFLGNWSVETGGTFDPTSYNPNEGAIGIGQWEGGRRTNLQHFAAANGTTETDLNTQLAFAYHELQTDKISAWNDLLSQSTPTGAARVIQSEFEVSSPDSLGERQSRAKQFYSSGLKGKSVNAPYPAGSLKAPLSATQKNAVLAYLKPLWTPGTTPDFATFSKYDDASIIVYYDTMVGGQAAAHPDPGYAVPGLGIKIPSWLDSLAKALAWLTDVHNWQRIGLFVLGGSIVLFAVIETFSGSSTAQTIGKVATHV